MAVFYLAWQYSTVSIDGRIAVLARIVNLIEDDTYIPFSQRTGLSPIPTQLRFGEISDELRRLLDYYLTIEMERERRYGYERYWFEDRWKRLASDLHVEFFQSPIDSFENDPSGIQRRLSR